MCITMPGKVIEIRGPEALVETAGRGRWCNAIFQPELARGDRVLVHAGLIIEVLTPEQAREMDETFAELMAIDGAAERDGGD